MPLQTLLTPSESAPIVARTNQSGSGEPGAAISAAVSAVREELTAASLLNAVASSGGVKCALRTLAGAVLSHARANRREGWVSDVLAVIKETGLAGAHDLPADLATIKSAKQAFSAGWVGMLAGMLQVGAWEIDETPKLDTVPDWLWADYTRWMFNAQPRFALTHSHRPLASQVKRAREVESWLARNVGSLTTRAAAEGLLRRENITDAGIAASVGWRELAQARGKILTKLFGTDRATYEPVVQPRHGRRLRLGFVSNNFGPSPDLLRTFPYFEQINPAAFEVFLFPLTASDTAEATYCTGAGRVAGTHLLPAGTAARVAFLREAQLDALVFVGDLLSEPSELTEIALHRVAPLQVVNAWSGTTSGLPEIDLAVSAAADLDEQRVASFTERVGVLRGPAVNISAALANLDAPHLTRGDLGLPEESPLMVACVDVGGASNAQLLAWAQMLSLTPGAHLAIAFLYEGETSLLARFCSAIDRVFEAQNIGRDRVHIFPAAPTRPREARGLIALADIFVDANAGPAASWAGVESLRLGIPPLTLGADVSASASLLKSIGLADLVGADAAAYVQIASDLMTDPERLKAVKAELLARVEAVPAFLDSLAASDAFGALIEATFDELSSLGHSEFRQQTEVVRCFGIDDLTEVIEVGLVAHAQGDLDTAASQAALALRSAPGDVRARQLYGVVLHAQGNLVRAIEYLVAAVQQSEATASTWYALALALRDHGQTGESIRALETCIRLDHRHVEALLAILELAEQVGATEIARDVLEALRLVAPDDARVLAMS
mgnify:CR=1 FL=1